MYHINIVLNNPFIFLVYLTLLLSIPQTSNISSLYLLYNDKFASYFTGGEKDSSYSNT